MTKKKTTPEASSLPSEIAQLKQAEMALSEAINALVNATEQQQRDPASFTHHRHIPKVLTRYRVEHKINKGDLALLAGITPNTLIKMEKNYSSMRVETLLSVLESLGLTLYVGPVDE